MGRLLWDGGLDSPFVCRGGARGGVIMGGGDYYGMGVWVNPLLPMGGGVMRMGRLLWDVGLDSPFACRVGTGGEL